jgi:ChrR Cupin-like domain
LREEFGVNAQLETIAENAVNRVASDEVPWLPYALIPNTFFRVLNVDEVNNIVVLNFKMPPWTVTPMHGHFCTATAYTLEGEWFYDDLCFGQGDIAYETTVEVHQPVSKEKGATLLTTLIGTPDDDRLLENYNEDGTTTVLRTNFFKAHERITVDEYMKLDAVALIC